MSSSTQTGKPSLRVVAIGGGTGLSTLLRGLKRYVAAPAAARHTTEAAPRNAGAPRLDSETWDSMYPNSALSS